MDKQAAIFMAVLAAMGGGSGGSPNIVQTNVLEYDGGSSGTASGTFTAGITSGNSIIIVGFITSSATASSVILSATDNKGSTGWTIDTTANTGPSTDNLCFVASCLAPIAGTTTVNITASTGTILAIAGMLEVNGVTGRGTHTSFSSTGSDTSPKIITNATANTSPRALVVHAMTAWQYSTSMGMTANAGVGTFIPIVANQDATIGKTWGICGYVSDVSAVTDSIINTWAVSGSTIAQVLATFYLV